jgi:hypothetical protein
VDATQLDQVVRETLAADPDPPRSVPHPVLLRHSLLNAPAVAVIVVGVVTLGIVGRFTLTGELAPGQESPVDAFSVLLAALGLGLIGLPLLTYVRLARSLRRGVRVVARVTELEVADTPAEVERASARRRVRGQRLIEHPQGLVEEPFAFDVDWAGDLTVGSEMEVLADPQRPRALLELGSRPER